MPSCRFGACSCTRPTGRLGPLPTHAPPPNRYRTSAGLHALVGDALWPIDEARPDAERPAEPAPVGGSGLLCAVLGDGAGHHWAETCLRDRVFDPETGASYPIPAREAVFVGVTRDGGFRAFYRDGASILLSPEAPPRARPLNLASP